MLFYLIIIVLVGVVFFAAGRQEGERSSKVKKNKEKRREVVRVDRSALKEERKEKIVEVLRRGEGQRITNNEVEKMFGVSDATATNYFDELESEGKIVQVGKTGHAVYYILK